MALHPSEAAFGLGLSCDRLRPVDPGCPLGVPEGGREATVDGVLQVLRQMIADVSPLVRVHLHLGVLAEDPSHASGEGPRAVDDDEEARRRGQTPSLQVREEARDDRPVRVEPSHSPTDTFVPSAVITRQTTQHWPASSIPSTMTTATLRLDRSQAFGSESACSVAFTARREIADLLVAFAVLSSSVPTGSATVSWRRVATLASMRSTTRRRRRSSGENTARVSSSTSSPSLVRPRGRHMGTLRPPTTTEPGVEPCQLALRAGIFACLGPMRSVSSASIIWAITTRPVADANASSPSFTARATSASATIASRPSPARRGEARRGEPPRHNRRQPRQVPSSSGGPPLDRCLGGRPKPCHERASGGGPPPRFNRVGGNLASLGSGSARQLGPRHLVGGRLVCRTRRTQ